MENKLIVKIEMNIFIKKMMTMIIRGETNDKRRIKTNYY